MCVTLGVPGTMSRACKSGGGGGGETLRENTGGAIPRESSWMHRAQIVDWSGKSLRILENRGDIWQVEYWEASWKQYKWIVIVRVLENGTTIRNPGTPN